MRTLTDERYAPITSAFGFLEVPLDEAAHFVESWWNGLGDHDRTEPVVEAFPEVLKRLQPLHTGGGTTVLLVETDSAWTAVFDSHIPHPDPVGLIGHTTSSLGCRGLITQCASIPASDSDASRREIDAVSFQLLGQPPTDGLNYTRVIQLVRDAGLHFILHGTPQPYESPEAYRALRKRDRFNSDLLERYCAAIGIRVFDENFYRPRAVLIERGSWVKPALSMSLEEAQAYYAVVPYAARSAKG